MTILDQLSRIEDKISLLFDADPDDRAEGQASGQSMGERDPDSAGISGKQPDPGAGSAGGDPAPVAHAVPGGEPVKGLGPEQNVVAKEPVSMAGGGSMGSDPGGQNEQGMSSGGSAHGGSTGSWGETPGGGGGSMHGGEVQHGASGSWEASGPSGAALGMAGGAMSGYEAAKGGEAPQGGGPNEAAAAETHTNVGTEVPGFGAVGATAGVNAALSGAPASGEASKVGAALSDPPEAHSGGPGIGGGGSSAAAPSGGGGGGGTSASISTSMPHAPSGTMGGGADPINSMAMMHAGAPASLPGYGKQRGGDSAYVRLRRIFWP